MLPALGQSMGALLSGLETVLGSCGCFMFVGNGGPEESELVRGDGGSSVSSAAAESRDFLGVAGRGV